MARLNSKERQKQLAHSLSLAAFWGLLLVVDTLLRSRETIWLYGILVAVYALAALVLARRMRPRAAAWLFLLSSFPAALSVLPWKTADSLLAARMAAICWGAAVVLMLWDWMTIEGRPLVREEIQHFPAAARIPALAGDGQLLHPADEARATVLERLRVQAIAAGTPLTENELQFVDYSRIPSREMAEEVEEQFDQGHDYWGFKEKVIHLLAEAVRSDRSRDPGSYKKYKALIRELSGGRRDHQLLVWLRAGFAQARTPGEAMLDKAMLWGCGLAIVGALIGGAWFFAITVHLSRPIFRH